MVFLFTGTSGNGGFGCYQSSRLLYFGAVPIALEPLLARGHRHWASEMGTSMPLLSRIKTSTPVSSDCSWRASTHFIHTDKRSSPLLWTNKD